MAKKSDTRNERLEIHLNPPRHFEGLKAVEDILFECMWKEFIGPLSDRCILARLESAHDIARRYERPMATWPRFQHEKLPDSAHDPAEFADYFNEKQAQVKEHAEALLALLKNNHFPPVISSVIGATKQLYVHPAGHASERTTERSLEARLAELVRSIDLPREEKGRPKSKRGKGAARAEAVQAVLHMWLEIGGPAPRLQRDGSAGASCGPFNDFAEAVLRAYGIQHNGLEAFVNDAVHLFKAIPESQLERLRNQYRVTHQ